jgi:hypothetical protein
MKKYFLANLCLYANEVAPAKSDFAFTAIARHIHAYSVFALPRDGSFQQPLPIMKGN